MTWIALTADLLWRNAWAVVPLAAVVVAACACVRFRPATRHTLWLIVLLGLVVPLILPALPMPGVFERVVAAAREDAGAVALVGRAAPGVDVPSPSPSLRGRGIATPGVDVPSPGPSLRGRGVEEPGPESFLCETASPELVVVADDAAAVPADESLWTLGDSAKPSPPPAWIEPCVSEELPATPGSVEPRRVVEAEYRGNPIEPWAVGVADVGESLPRESAAAPVATTPGVAWWQPWLVAAVGVWDAVGRVPRIPLIVWGGGIVLLVLWQAGWIFAFLRRLRGAVAAPAGVQRMVDEAAAEMGLRRAPAVSMVDGCLSPMIWCGHGLRLILPTRLWGQLDWAGRKAILYHELAHVRRRDHWVCWLGLVLGAVYWWHPVVWWARRRLHEEADLCCDAWVTWLMPQRRRQYAEALLRTKVFIGGRGPLVPAGGMGATSVGARRFARRLTMVMTTSARPGLSRPGLVLAAVVALVGWMAVPGWATPDRPPTQVEKAKTKVEIVPSVETPDVPDAPDAPDAALSGKLKQLEKELQALSRQLDELRGLQGQTGRAPRGVRAPRGWAAPRSPQVPAQVAPPAAPAPPACSTPRLLGGGFAGNLGAYLEASNEEQVRSYKLPKGKLEALTQLMVREDVPVRVVAHEDSIEVHGTAAQQRRFAAFVELIEPTGKPDLDVWGYAGPQAEAAMNAYGEAFEKQGRAFAKLNDAMVKARSGGWARAYGDAMTIAPDAKLWNMLSRETSVDEKIAALNAMIEQLNAQASGRAEKSAALEAEAEELNEQAVALDAQAEELGEQADELSEQASDAEDRAQARALQAQARGLERQARELERKARGVERRAEEMEQAAARLDRSSDELNVSVDQLQEALDMLSSVSQIMPLPTPAPVPAPVPTPTPAPMPVPSGGMAR